MERITVACGDWTCRALVARTFSTRRRGLRPDASLGPIFIPGASVHGLGMRVPLSVVALDRALVVLEVRRLRPGRVMVVRGARWMLELPPGMTLPSGDRLSIVEGCLAV